MNRPHQNKPNPVIQRLYREAEEAWGLQDYQKSIGLIEQATRKDPSNPLLLLDLARAYGRRYDYPAAERYIEKAVQISQSRARTLEEAGRVCMEFGNIEMALGFLERASQRKGVSVGALTTLADIYMRDKRMDEAAEIVARASQIDRKEPRVLFEDAALRRLRGKTQEAGSLLRDLLTNPASVPQVRMRASYELAGILDGEGQYDEAMVALLEAKAILRAHAAPHAATLQHMQNRAKEMEQTITTAVLDRWRADAAKLHAAPAHRAALRSSAFRHDPPRTGARRAQ